MKRICVFLVLVCLFSGCRSQNRELERALALRQQMLASQCRFDAEITADYGDKLYQFSVQCTVDAEGNLDFTVTSPESLSGIRGNISEAGGKLTFDETALYFPLLADQQLSPVSAPWILTKTLRSGYLTSAGAEGDLVRLSIDDSYQEDALNLDIWINGEDKPVQADILHNGTRILSVKVDEFHFL